MQASGQEWTLAIGGMSSSIDPATSVAGSGTGKLVHQARRMSRRSAAIFVWAAVAAFAGIVPDRAIAQLTGMGVPSAGYFSTFAAVNDGQYRDALANFQQQGRGAIKTAQSRWIDSICYHAMTGECYYQMGRPGEALEHYNSAVNLFLAFPDWMIRVRFPALIQQSSARTNFPWGHSKRGAMPGAFPDTIPIAQGQPNPRDTLKTGGVVQNPILLQIDVDEIVRCTALAIRRRRELLGPVCKHDPLTASLIDRLSVRPGPGNHWAQAWIDTQLGLAYASAGATIQAESALKRSLVVAGQFDHPLTGVALLELGRLAVESGNYPAAARYFEEATYAAAVFGDLGVLEEAFRLGQHTHLVVNQKDIYPPLPIALAWAKSTGYRQLHASLALLSSENLAVLGETAKAGVLLTEARGAIGRRDMARGSIGNRANYVAAVVAYQAGNLLAGDQAMAEMLAYGRNSSLRVFQMAIADRMARSDETGRQTMAIYSVLLNDPTPLDWAFDPIECLMASSLPNFMALERWYDAALRRKETDRALEIADLTRRRRFTSTLPLGGRLLNLRWILEAPPTLLNQAAVLERQDLLARHPRFAELSEQARKLRTDLGQRPLVPTEADARRAQSEEINHLAGVSHAQEAILREMSVRRNPVEPIFPPQLSLKEIRARLAPGHVLMSFFTTSRGIHAVLLSRDKSAAWRIASPERLKRQTVTLLRDLGNWESNHVVNVADLKKAKWKQSAKAVLDLLLDGSQVDLAAKFEELTIVPDGFLWYLPFETLPVGPRQEPLISRVRIRYAPTMALAVPSRPAAKPEDNVGFVLGKLYPQHKPEVAQAAFERLQRALPAAVSVPAGATAPSMLLRSRLDELVVLDDIEPVTSGPYDWSPAQVDRSKPTGSLAAWLALPWGGPQVVILPGYHTAAENAMKKNGTGNDLFLTACGLMASGVRTILISRWRTGGQTSFDLVREFAQELPHMDPAKAWQRSVQVVCESPLDPELEPRIKRSSQEAGEPKADHPFFWSGYVLIDSGSAETDAAVPGAVVPGAVVPGAAPPNAAEPPPAPPAPAANPLPGAGKAR